MPLKNILNLDLPSSRYYWTVYKYLRGSCFIRLIHWNHVQFIIQSFIQLFEFLNYFAVAVGIFEHWDYVWVWAWNYNNQLINHLCKVKRLSLCKSCNCMFKQNFKKFYYRITLNNNQSNDNLAVQHSKGLGSIRSRWFTPKFRRTVKLD